MKYKIGDKLICIKDIYNLLNNPLFVKGNTYKVLSIIDNEDIILDHILYANEYGDFTENFVNKNFINLKELRKQKLLKIENGIDINKSL